MTQVSEVLTIHKLELLDNIHIITCVSEVLTIFGLSAESTIYENDVPLKNFFKVYIYIYELRVNFCFLMLIVSVQSNDRCNV